MNPVMSCYSCFTVVFDFIEGKLFDTEDPEELDYLMNTANETKMTSLFSNTIRMIYIVIAAYFKLKIKK